MLKLNLGIIGTGLLFAVGCSGGDLGRSETGSASASGNDTAVGSTSEEIVRGTTENGRNYVMYLRIGYQSVTSGHQTMGNCSAVLYAPRTLLTAAHCIRPIRNAGTPNQFVDNVSRMLVYIGNNYDADLQALTTAGGGDPFNGVPAAPAASKWMKADSWEAHPSYDATGTLYPDLALVYLDREPRLPTTPTPTKIDALPIGRTRLGQSAVGLPFTVVGYGANIAFSEDIQQNAGAGLKRSGLSPFVGTPVTNPLPPHPHPGLGNPTVVAGLLQLNGTAPNANGCAGDSGSPTIRSFNGQEQVWGISSWTGDFCEKFSYYTRLDAHLPFLDAGYQKGGQAQTSPRLECVATNPNGGLRAYFGYNNANGVIVNVPYGTNNQFAADTTNQRPTSFKPGDHPYVFGVNIPNGQTISYKLSPPNSSTTTLNVNASSPRCAPTSLTTACAQSCDASTAACPGSTQSFEDCAAFCRTWQTDVGVCVQEFANYNLCIAGLPASQFTCDPDFGGFPNEGNCQTQIDALNACFENPT
ncbi:MAG TPA: trypsin-like serine protease [Polyangiaceae bacterium]|nr:trypsin-like serine protease [Polyangiaceae bacterium]